MTTRNRTSRLCKVHGCTAGEHSYLGEEKDDLCSAIAIGEGPGNETWHVAAYRDEKTGLWEAFCEEPELPQTLEGVAGLLFLEKFAMAFRTVQQHCDLLNKLGARA